MSRLTVPQSPVSGGATAAVPRPVDDGIGQAATEFGDRLVQAGDRLETDRLSADLGRARVGIANGLAGLRLETERQADPDQIDASWTARTGELRAQLVQGVDPKNQEAAGLAFDELAGRHGLAVGQRANELRASRGRAGLIELGTAHDATPGIADFELRNTLNDQYAQQLAAELALGHIQPEEVPRLLAGRKETLAEAAAIRLLSEAPARLLAEIDGSQFNDLSPEKRERYRASAIGEGERLDAKRQTEAASMAEASAIRGLSDDPGQLIADIDAGRYPEMSAEQQARYRAAAVAAAERDKALNAARTDAAAKVRSDAIGDQLAELSRVAVAGRTLQGEAALLVDPEAQKHPGFVTAQASIKLRQTVPGFALMSPSDMDAQIATEAARPVTGAADTALLEVMRSTRDAAAVEWKSDPIGYAAELGLVQPAALPADLSNPQDWLGVLRQRRSLGAWLVSKGYAEQPAVFTAEERAQLATFASVATPPQDRATLAATIATGLGPDADAAFKAIAPDDPVFRHFGLLIAAGGGQGTALAAFRGQQALAGKVAKLPGEDARRLALAETLGDAMRYLPAQTGEVMAAADALYGEFGANIDPKEDPDAAAEAYGRAIQSALGRSAVNARSQAGGVQEINGRPTLLPLDLSSDQVEDALDALDELGDADPSLLPEAGTREKMRALSVGVLARASVSGGAPGYANGKPLAWSDIEALRFVADAQSGYVVQIEARGDTRDLVDLTTGGPFRIDLRRLVRESDQFGRTVRDAQSRPEPTRP